jgi:glycopeptide antibiotics resistance protein
MLSVSLLRDAIQANTPLLTILLGSVPNLFAGITFVFWLTYIVSSKAINAFMYSFVILVIGEVIQLFMDNQSADWWDLLASFLGSSSGALVVRILEK